jgi:DNA-binding transcriptional regulator GbsR (MarR family)
MKDFDSLQNLTSENVRGMLPAVPKELVEAFGHDPAGVTGPTRRLQGWRAVEDIHHRVHRQQHTFRSFLDTFDEQPLSGQCALDKPIEILEMLLEDLEKQKTEITADAENVSQLLKSTQEVHGKLKEIYNKMVSHVSVVYPQVFTRYYHLANFTDNFSSYHISLLWRKVTRTSINNFGSLAWTHSPCFWTP